MPAPDPTPLLLTGERTVPAGADGGGPWHEAYWFARHEAGYRALAEWLPRGGTVLDAGCGEGYAAPLLRELGAGRVALVDYDGPTLAHVRASYAGADVADVAAVRANLVALPFADGSLDAVTCLQVIEHIWTPWELLGAAARVLAPGAPLLLTTPNRLTFSPGLARGAKPLNPFHIKEYDAQELAGEVAAHLEVEAVLGIAHGPRLAAWEREHGPLVEAQHQSPPESWDADLAAVVRSVRADDFVVTDDVEGCLDLLVVARRSAP